MRVFGIFLAKRIIFILIVLFGSFKSECFIIASSKLSGIKRLHKTEINSPKILTGTAIVRFKQTNYKTNYKNLNSDIKSILPKKYTIVEYLLTPNRAISKDTARMSTYAASRVERIKFLEDKLLRTAIIKFDTTIDVLHFCKYLINSDENIELAEAYYIAELLSIPNDPKVNQQKVLQTISAFDAWDLSTGDETVLIGISDDGVNWGHEDLKESISVNIGEIPNNGIDDDNNGYIDDYYGYNFTWFDDDRKQDDIFTQGHHGTNVAGIIAARTNNNIGIAGVGYNCKIVPMKTSTVANPGDVIYGYQSMIYAAVRNCKVLNCSWGIPEVHSEIFQTVVDYATECGVSIIAAGGNIGSNSAGNYSSFYPAGYFGVLGVGEVNANDIASNNIVFGVPVRIMAPAIGNWSVTGTNNYTQVSSGSSYATPVVSGVMGLIFSQFPELSPLEAQELLRRSGDFVQSQSIKDSAFIPLRVNAHSALLGEQLESPAIILKEHFFTNKNNELQDKVNIGDTLVLNLRILNVLSSAVNINLKISQIFCLDAEAYNFIDTSINIGLLDKNETVLCKARVIINNPENYEALYKIYLTGSGLSNNSNYKDAFKIKLKTTSNITTFRNELMTISVSDEGAIGYSTPTNVESFGYGFAHKKLGNFIYEGGVVAVSDMQKAVSTNLDSETYGKNSFFYEKKITEDGIGVIKDTRASISNRIGLEITNKYILPSDSSTAMKIIISAKNISGKELNDFAIGHFYDWDVGISNARNKVEYCSECIPDWLDVNNAAVEIAYDALETTYVGSLVYSENKDLYTVPQAAGFIRTSEMNKKSEQVKMLTSGVSRQVGQITDISYIVGMHFFDPMKNNESRVCYICTAVDSTKEKLIKSLAECAKNNYGSIATKEEYLFGNENDGFHIVLETENLYIRLLDPSLINSKIELFDINSIRYLSKIVNSEITTINLADYPTGIYFLKVLDENSKIRKIQKINLAK